MGTALPSSGKFVWRTRHFELVSWSNNSFGGAAHGCEKVCCCLPRRTLESQRFKVCFGMAGVTEENLASFIKDYDFVKDLFAMEVLASRPGFLQGVRKNELTSYASWDAW